MSSWEQRLGTALGVLRLDSIKSKIVALAVLATLVPAMSTAVLSYVQNRRALTETLEGELSGIGSQAARELDLWVKERLYDVRVFVSSFEVTENVDRIASGGPVAAEARTRLANYLRGVQGRFDDYTTLLVVDAAGLPITSSLGETQGGVTDDWLSRLQRGEVIVGEPYDAGSVVAVQIAQPIETADVRFLGALVTTVTFGAVEDMLRSFARGEGGRVDLVLPDGRRIVGSREEPGLEAVVSEDVLAVLRSAEGGTVEYVTDGGADVLGVLTEVPGSDWAIVTQVPSGEAYAQVAQLRNSSILLVSGLLILVGGIAYVLGLVIVRPLDRLAAGARSVAAGDLSVDIPVTSGGEVGYLTSVFNGMVSQLRESREELRAQNAELERLSMTDTLTGLYNRRFVMGEFEKELHRAQRYDRTVACLMLDVDSFKQYNDTYGHLAGDEVLSGLGRVLEDATRDHDVPGRYGGEEFIVLLPDCGLDGAVEAGERIRRRLSEEVFEGGEVTCSIGAAVFPAHADSPTSLIAAADTALYFAKEGGRDQVVAATLPDQPTAKGDPKKRRRSEDEKKAAAKKDAKKTAAAKKKAATKKKKAANKPAAKKKGTSDEAAPE